jgi:hypothetical protein
MHKVISLPVLFLIPFLLLSCSEDVKVAKKLSGTLCRDTIGFEFAAYYLTKPQVPPEEMLRRRIDTDSSQLFSYLQSPDSAGMPSVMVCRVNSIQRNYPPPDTSMLKRFGFGLSSEQILSLQKPADVLIMDFASDRKHLREAYGKALDFLYDITLGQDAIIYDQNVKACYTPQEWKTRRIDTWHCIVPDISSHLVTRIYQDGEYCRAVTMGMGKFGLPDFELDGISSGKTEHIDKLLNLTCQTLAEKGQLPASGMLSLDIDSLRSENLKKTLIESLGAGAKRKAVVSLTIVRPRDGDPSNRLLGIRHSKDDHDYHSKLIALIFGGKDSLSQPTK